MSDNIINKALYTILALSLFLYIYFNIIATGNTSRTMAVKHDTIGMENMVKEDKKREEAGREIKEQESSVESHGIDETEDREINPVGFHLYVDLDQTKMYVYKDGELIKTYEVSGGKPSSPSPTGTWKIISKDTWGEGFGGAWMGFNVPWGMYGIHGTTEPWFVGRDNTSKGCIRMKNADVRELYRMVPYNTIVTIVHKTRPFYPMRDGDIGPDVLNVERALKKLGYYNGSEDGIFGSSLRIAVIKFQKDHRLYRTGVINNSTYEAIMEAEKEMELE